MTPQQLKNSILQQAIEGKLVEQRAEEGTGEELYQQIQKEKQKLIKEGKIKKEKPLPPITEEEIPFEIPKSWKWCRLGELFEINPRNQLDDNLEVGFMPMAMLDGGVLTNHMSFESRKWKNVKSNFSHFKEGDIVIAKITPCFQNLKSGIIKNCPSGYGAGTTELHVLRDFSRLYTKYFLAFVKSPAFVIDSQAAMTGTAGQQRVGTLTVKQHPVPLPPLAEQKRIVAKIEELQPYLDQYEQAYNRLENFNKRFPDDMKKSILQMAIEGKLVEQRPEEGTGEELYQQIQKEKQKLIKEGKIKKEKPLPPITVEEIPFEIPENWKWCRCSDLFNIRSANRIHKTDWRSDGIPFLRGRELVQLSNYGKVLNPEIFIDESFYEQLKDKSGVPKKDDILVSAVGTIGKVYIVKGTKKFYYKDAYILCFENFGKLYSPYFKLTLESPNLQYQIHDGAMATTVAQLTIIKAKSLIIPLPPLAEQKRIVAKIEELLPLCKQLKNY